ncbi:hypothetical protein [Colwellia sp. MEBiC06753]
MTVSDQGCYLYQLNNEFTDIIEPWQIAKNPQNHLRICSARFVPSQNIKLLVNYLKTATEVTVMIEWHNPDNAEQYFGYYQLTNEHLLWQVDSKQFITCVDKLHQITLPKALLFFPLMRIFSGEVIKHLSTHGSYEVLIPDIRNLTDSSDFLAPYLSTRAANIVQQNVSITNFEQQQVADEYQYTSDIYHEENNARFWLDKQHRLIKYCWQQTPEHCWTVLLKTL